jgi:hypothetical protein
MKNKTMFLRYLVLMAGLLLVFGSCKKNSGGAPNPSGILPADSAAGNATVYITGNNLGGITSIMFSSDSVPAPFNSNFNTNNAIIFRVPDTAFGGPQKIIFTNKAGQTFSVAFNVLAFPSVSSVSNYDFNPGDTITLTGNNLESTNSVTLSDGTALTIVSKSHKQVVVIFPATQLTRSFLTITNSTGSVTTSQEFLSIANAYVIYANGNFGQSGGVSSGSWGPSGQGLAPTPLYKNDPSFFSTYGQGDWWANGFAFWNPPYFPKDPSYTYFTFWIYGGSLDYTFYITASCAAGGSYGNSDVSNPIDVQPNQWNFYKLKISSLGLISGAANFEQLGWWVKGPNTTSETMYFDDVMFVK